MNSRAKGVRGELDARDFLREHGYEAERGQQHAGGADSQDLRHNVAGVHFEVKRVEGSGQVYDWIEQAARDCGGAIPVVLHRRNPRKAFAAKARPWLAIMPAEDFLRLHRSLVGEIERNNPLMKVS